MSLKYKDIIKKFGKIALCSAAVLGTIGTTAILNEQKASALTYELEYDGPNRYYPTEAIAGDTISSITLDYNSSDEKQTLSIFKGDSTSNYSLFEAGKYRITFGSISVTYGYNRIYAIDSSKNLKEGIYFSSTKNQSASVEITITGDRFFVLDIGDYSEDVTLKNVKIEKVNEDNVRPVFYNAELNYYVSVDSGYSLDTILKNVYVEDDQDGRIDYNITQDDYSANKNKIGEYTVKLHAVDKSSNENTLTITVHVIDATAPVISGKNTWDSPMSSPITEATIRAGLSANDNVDSSVVVTLKNDGFTGNEQKKGTYTIIYTATDSSDNTSADFSVTVNVKDDIKPVIFGNNNYQYTASTAVANLAEQLKTLLKVNDNADSGLSVTIKEDNYTDHRGTVGTYTIVYTAVDKSGNVADDYVVTIKVVDSEAPYFFVGKQFIGVDEAVTLTHAQIVDIILQQNNIDTTQVVAYKFNTDNYTENASVVGAHTVSFSLQMKDGTVQDIEATIKVIGEEETQAPAGDEAKEENKIKEWFKNSWNWIKNHAVYFYVGLGALVAGIGIALGFKKKDE